MCTYFEVETDVAQNLVDDFFFFKFWLSDELSIGRILNGKKMVCGVNFLKKQVL